MNKKNFIKINFHKNKIYIKDLFIFSRYLQFHGEEWKTYFMKKYNYFTKIIDLKRDCKNIKKSFGKSAKNQINRAKKLPIKCGIYDLEQNFKFYKYFIDRFAKNKNRNFLSYDENLNNDLKKVITFAKYENQTIVFHTYTVDYESKTAILLHSASKIREKNIQNDKKLKRVIGYANRYLHYWDMCYFKKMGFKKYDIGGYAVDTEDEELKKINIFKNDFRGIMIDKSHYESYPLYFSRKIYHILKRKSV